MYLYILGINFISRTTEELSPCLRLITRCPRQGRDVAIALCVLSVYLLPQTKGCRWPRPRQTHLQYWNTKMLTYGLHLPIPNTSVQEKKWQQFFTSSFIHSVSCLTTCPKPPSKRFLHIVRSRASSFKWEYPLLSLRSSSSFSHLLFTTPFKKLSIFPHNIPFFGCFSQLPSFQKDRGPCVTTGVSVLLRGLEL